MPILGTVASSKLKVTGVFDSIATATPTSGTFVTFSSIPQTYDHLQLRMLIYSATGSSFRLRINEDSTSSRYTVYWGPYAVGSGIESAEGYNTSVYNGIPTQGQADSLWGQWVVVDIFNYTASIKPTVQLYYQSLASSTSSRYNGFVHGTYHVAGAVNSLEILTGTLASPTSYALYGVKAS